MSERENHLDHGETLHRKNASRTNPAKENT